MARPKIALDVWRPQIEQWIKDGLGKEEIQRRLQDEANVKIGYSTLSTQLRRWGVRKNRSPIKKSDALRDRVKELFHTQPNMRDEQMFMLLQEEGFQISAPRALARLRKDNGLYKRVEKEGEEKIREEIIEAMRKEFGDDMELPDDLATRELSVYLRSKYNLVGRDRIRRIATELKPDWAQRRRKLGQFPRAAPSGTPEAETATQYPMIEPPMIEPPMLEPPASTSSSLQFSGTIINYDFQGAPWSPKPSPAQATVAQNRVYYSVPSSSTAFTNIFGLAPDWLDPTLLNPR